VKRLTPLRLAEEMRGGLSMPTWHASILVVEKEVSLKESMETYL
jgi:hypothetical protein